ARAGNGTTIGSNRPARRGRKLAARAANGLFPGHVTALGTTRRPLLEPARPDPLARRAPATAARAARACARAHLDAADPVLQAEARSRAPYTGGHPLAGRPGRHSRHGEGRAPRERA